MKLCSKCNIIKSLKEFSKSGRTRGNFHNWCKNCCHINYLENREKIIKQKLIYKKTRSKTDIEYKLKLNLRIRLTHAIRRNYKSGSAVRDLGCSIQFLKQYLESKFLPGMSWDNYGYGTDKWNIDHIIPLSSFYLTDREQLLKACHYTNLQPLWHIDNVLKSNI